MAEIAVVASRKAKLETEAKKGDRSYQVAFKLSQDPNRFLSTVQIGITLTGILLGVYSGEGIRIYVQQQLMLVPVLAPYAQSLGLGLVVVMLTFFTLTFGELIPKRIGYANPEKLAAFFAIPMSWLSKASSPLVYLLTGTSELFFKVFKIKASTETAVSEEELKLLIHEATEDGELEEEEKRIIDRVFHLGDRKIGSLMTYRTDLVWLDTLDSWEFNCKTIIDSVHKAYLLCEEELDKPFGFVFLTDILKSGYLSKEFDLKTVVKPVLYVPEGMTSYALLKKFKDNSTHTAIVIDEYGSIEGVITLNDLSEILIGEFPDSDHSELEIIQRDENSWFVDGGVSFEDFIDYFHIEKVDVEEKEGFHTLAGFIFNFLEHIPKVGDFFEWRNLKIEIVDLDGNRIDKVIITRLEKTENLS